MDNQQNSTTGTNGVTSIAEGQTSGTNNMVAILSYLGILVFIPLVINKDNQFVKFHTKQGLVLFIVMIVSTFVLAIPLLGWVAGPIMSLGCFGLMILGILNVVGNKQNQLPIIGGFADKFNF